MHPNARKCIRLLTRAAICRFSLTLSFVAPAVLQYDGTSWLQVERQEVISGSVEAQMGIVLFVLKVLVSLEMRS